MYCHFGAFHFLRECVACCVSSVVRILFFSLLFLCCFRMCSVWRAVDCTWRDIITYIYISLSIVCARSSCGLYTNWNGEYIIYTVVLGASTNKTTSIHKQQFHLFQFVVFFFCSLLSRSVSSIVVSKTYFDFSMFDGS